MAPTELIDPTGASRIRGRDKHMTNHPNRRRIWKTESGTVCLREPDEYGRPIVREFWVPPGGGYVREIDARHPGTLGAQVCAHLSSRGYMLSSSPEGLLDLIRREQRRWCAAERQQEKRRGY